MTNIWAVMMHTLGESHRRRVWIPFLAAALLGVLAIIMGFGIELTPNTYADTIISSVFMSWSWGTILTALCLGATSIPTERQSETLFTLPIHRWELLVGKLCGNLVLLIGIHLAGYLISVALAFHSSLPVPAYSVLALVEAITLSFAMLSLSIPLGMRMQPLEAGTLTIVILVAVAFVANLWVDPINPVPFGIRGMRVADPISYAFFNGPVISQQFLGIAANLAESVVLLGLFGFLFRRTELVGKAR
jgi:ABC-type transport system involved in multi-copper enzyme maturation permease subunit